VTTANAGKQFPKHIETLWFHWEEKKGLGVLDAAFSDGAEIYVVTWYVFRESSLKIAMRQLGNDEIPWLKRREGEKRESD
jgi:hypothetical protein